jgi:hypothetical protein
MSKVSPLDIHFHRGNFGVVTSLRVRLHPAHGVLAGSIIYDWNEAAAVLRRYAACAARTPDELGVAVGAMSGPDGVPVTMVIPLLERRAMSGRACDGKRASLRQAAIPRPDRRPTPTCSRSFSRGRAGRPRSPPVSPHCLASGTTSVAPRAISSGDRHELEGLWQ